METTKMAGTRKDDGSMTKSDLVDSVSNKLQLPRGKAELIVNGVFDCMERALRSGNRIEIRGFGSFEIRHYKAYEGRNPRTGDPVGVQPKRLPFFKVGKELKERVNDGYQRELARAGVAEGASNNAASANGASTASAVASRL
jgi:integration host factor subunit beta